MTEIDTTCPRCDPNKRTPDGGSEGYIWWDDATEEEQQASGGPDGDNEIQCPTCEGTTELPAAVVAEIEAAAVEQERLRELAENAPPAKFSIEWVDDDNAKVIATMTATNADVQIGLLNFDWNSWCFVKLDRDGTQLPGATTIECDPDTEHSFRVEHEAILADNTTSAVEKAKVKALTTRLHVYRDDSRELAALGARIEARKWWREFSAVA